MNTLRRNRVFFMAHAVQGMARWCARRPKKWAAENAKDRFKCGQCTNLGALRWKIKCDSNSRRLEYEKGNSVTNCKGRFGNEKNFRKNGASNFDTWPETTSSSHFFWFLHNAEMFDSNITVDETLCFQYDTETKRQSMQWITQNSHRPKKQACLCRKSRTCLCVSSITRG